MKLNKKKLKYLEQEALRRGSQPHGIVMEIGDGTYRTQNGQVVTKEVLKQWAVQLGHPVLIWDLSTQQRAKNRNFDNCGGS
jgi:hypothetical protein